jgi:hypothetical protein
MNKKATRSPSMSLISRDSSASRRRFVILSQRQPGKNQGCGLSLKRCRWNTNKWIVRGLLHDSCANS